MAQMPSEFINDVPVQFARTHGLIALSREGNLSRVATYRPLEEGALETLEKLDCLAARNREWPTRTYSPGALRA